MNYLYLPLLLSFLFVVSCNKENTDIEPCVIVSHNTPDTIIPSEYLMTYPGSWWEYYGDLSGEQIDSCFSWENVGGNSTSSFSGNCEYLLKDIHVLPYCNSGCFSNDSRIYVNSNNEITRTQKIVDTQLGQIDDYYLISGQGTQNQVEYSSTTYVVEVLNSLEVNGTTYNDVIHTEESISYEYLGGGNPSYLRAYYYAKDVGVIMKVFSIVGSTGHDTLKLVNHYIAPH